MQPLYKRYKIATEVGFGFYRLIKIVTTAQAFWLSMDMISVCCVNGKLKHKAQRVSGV